MAEKTMALGTVGPAGNTVSWRGVVDDDTLAAGRATEFHVEVTREEGGVIAPPGVHVAVLKVPLGGFISIDPPGPNLATGIANQLEPGETQVIDFHINNGPGGATPAAYALVLFIFWAGSGFIPPATITVGAPF